MGKSVNIGSSRGGNGFKGRGRGGRGRGGRGNFKNYKNKWRGKKRGGSSDFPVQTQVGVEILQHLQRLLNRHPRLKNLLLVVAPQSD